VIVTLLAGEAGLAEDPQAATIAAELTKAAAAASRRAPGAVILIERESF
jgi:hypothetical protein